MALKTVIENLNKAREEYEHQLATLGNDVQKAIGESLASAIPDGYKLRWTQYTPYFNDGDACVFRVHEPYVIPVDSKSRHADEDGFELDTYYIKKYGTDDSYYKALPGVTKTQLEELHALWKSLPEDLLEKVFGDHIEVTVKRDGSVSVDEYSHD